MSSKNLHKHSLPIVLLAIAAIVASVGLASVSSSNPGRNALADALVSKSVSVKTTSAYSAAITSEQAPQQLPNLSVAANHALMSAAIYSALDQSR